MGSAEQVDSLREMARRDGITHLHLRVIHYDKGPKELRVEPSRRRYEDFWDADAQNVILE